MNSPVELHVIEEHGEDGCTWLVSTTGPNPEREDCVVCRDKEHAFYIKSSAAKGFLSPFLDAATTQSEVLE